MHVFTVHMRRHGLDPDRDFALVKEGFSWTAFLFTAVWALYHRLWLAAAVVLGVFVLLDALGPKVGVAPPVLAVMQIGVSVLFGYVANDLRRRVLRKSGFAEADVVVAKNLTGAEQRYFDRNPIQAERF